MTDSPEIKALTGKAFSPAAAHPHQQTGERVVFLASAIQAVRDTEARCANPLVSSTNAVATNIEQAARREAFREAVEACERAGRTIGSGAEAARMLSKAFLSPVREEKQP